mgnify:FL=1
MSEGKFGVGVKTGIADAEVKADVSPAGVKADVELTVQPEVRDLVSAAGGMALAAVTGPWGPAILVGAGAALYFYRRHKPKAGTP